jgi:hypothetical protein
LIACLEFPSFSLTTKLFVFLPLSPGSYPHASQFYYTTTRGKTDEADAAEKYEDEVGNLMFIA